MLARLQTQEIIDISYADAVPTTPFILRFPTNEPYEMLAIKSRITAAGGIVLPGINLADANGNAVARIGIIPWQFMNTTVETTTGQTPDPSFTPLFANLNIGGFIPSGLHVFDGWSLQWADFLSTPGVTFDSVITFALAKFDG